MAQRPLFAVGCRVGKPNCQWAISPSVELFSYVKLGCRRMEIALACHRAYLKFSIFSRTRATYTLIMALFGVGLKAARIVFSFFCAE